MREHGFARPAHVRSFRVIADHLQGEIGLDTGAHVEGAVVKQWPAAMGALDAAQIGADQPLQLQIWALATIMAQQHVFGRDGRVGLEFETPMPV